MNNTNTTSTTKTDMSIKLGGRVFEPAVTVVDGNPTTKDPIATGFQKQLQQFAKDHIPIESTVGIEARERALERVRAIGEAWVRSVSQRRGLSTTSTTQHCQLLTSGSYRLGVHEPGADIDTILVAPAICRREDFFGTTVDGSEQRDPDSLAERIRSHPDVTNFVPVEGAGVPLLTFDWEGINIDLLFARLATNTVPVDFDVNHDGVLDGVDSATEKSLNGPRVTNLIAAFCGGTAERYASFLATVRCVRKWAKARGLYSNKMGYWGGVNVNIAVAVTIQLYPNLSPAHLLRKFFFVFSTWDWPNPIMLTKPYDAGFGLTVWSRNASSAQPRNNVGPMITPAYPAMNSTFSLSRVSLEILKKELKRGRQVVDGLWEEYNRDYSEQGEEATVDWDQLFAPSEFFIAYPHYLSVCIVGPTQAYVQAWAGYVESRLRKLVSDSNSLSRLPLKRIQLWPKKVEACVADQSALLTIAQRQNCLTYFIGFYVDRLRMRGESLNMEPALLNFREKDLKRYELLVPGMDLLTKVFTVKQLPVLCFESLGGKPLAMQQLRRLREADPARQERKRQAQLKAMKEKLEAAEARKKRKIEEVEGSNDEPDAMEQDVAGTSDEPKATEGMDDGQDENREGLESTEELTTEKEDAVHNEHFDEDGYESDENMVGYSKDEARLVIVHPKNKAEPDDKFSGKRLLPVSDNVANALQSLGYPLRDETAVNLIGSNVANELTKEAPRRLSGKIVFHEKFDIVELDADGRVIDKGDDDFAPSNGWTGRKPGFEFKLGERGLGYYRTGKKVVVPSNTTY